MSIERLSRTRRVFLVSGHRASCHNDETNTGASVTAYCPNADASTAGEWNHDSYEEGQPAA